MMKFKRRLALQPLSWMPTGSNLIFRQRWLTAYNRIGHSLAVFPGIVIAYFVGLSSTEFSLLFLFALVLGLEAVILLASWVHASYMAPTPEDTPSAEG